MKKILTESQKLFEMMEKINPDFKRKETKTYEELSDEDKNLFNSIFKPETNFDRMGSASSPDYSGNYLMTREIKFWDRPDGQSFKSEIKNMVDQFNSQSKDFNVEPRGFQDYEIEDGERSYPASFMFTFIPKN